MSGAVDSIVAAAEMTPEAKVALVRITRTTHLESKDETG